MASTALTTSTTSQQATYCTPFTLPSLGVITIDASTTLTITQDVVFQPQCTSSVDLIDTLATSSVTDLRDPFYASTIPQCYALAATTVIAYTLFLMLLVTPRTFISGGNIVLGRRGFTNSGREAGIGIGGRPWLQKIAALTVAISLTIATVDTFKVAKTQYDIGYMDATSLQQQVLDGTELKVMRIISDTFLWLAQAQTLIRLFPRQREKVIIKWTAFALILLDLIFGILDSFVVTESYSRPRSFNEAIPALSYLFQLALGVLYCAWVIYYSITKKRYAYYHPQMRNICLVALLSIIALFVPIVFFMTDIINHQVASWGDYVRWVGAAAASVVVWEWVERIETLERNEKKDGVLGREVFDGDEMLDVAPASDSGHRKKGDAGSGSSSSTRSSGSTTKQWPTVSMAMQRYRPRLAPRFRPRAKQSSKPQPPGQTTTLKLAAWPARPSRIATPISRAETGSAESTVYAVRYHPIGTVDQDRSVFERPSPVPINTDDVDVEAQKYTSRESGDDSIDLEKRDGQVSESDTPVLVPPSSSSQMKGSLWGAIEHANPFSRKAKQPPAQISAHTAGLEKPKLTTAERSSTRWGVVGRLEDFAAVQAEKFSSRGTPQQAPVLPVTRIPAPPRARSQQQLNALLEEDEIRPPSKIIDEPAHTPIERSRDNRASRLSSSPSGLTRNVYTPITTSEPVVTQRGALSFATPGPRTSQTDSSSRHQTDASLLEASPVTVAQSQSPFRDALSRSQSSSSGNLPVIRIPAPPRPQRAADEDDEDD